MKKPFFSIITCTKDSGKFLQKNINSVKSQTLLDYEHIFIDGGSKDNTINLLNIYKNKIGDKIRIIKYPKKGVSAAFNKGIENSMGRYLIFLNSDDYFYDKEVLHDTHDFLVSHKELDWFYGKINVVEENGKTVGVFPLRKIFQRANGHLLKFVSYIPHQAVFIKKSIFNKFGDFDSKLKLSMDTDLWLRVAPKTNWCFFDRIISNYTVRRDSLSSSFENKDLSIQTLERVQKRYLSKIEQFFAKIVNRFVAAINKIYR